MASEREREAEEYLQKHQILELMENLISLLLFHRPEKPKAFLSEQLEFLKRSRHSGVRGPGLFTNNNLDTVFGILDPANRKYISYDQYKQALQTLGVRDINECPDGVNEDMISHDTFKTEA
ncbi:hypothetical protein NQD34_004129 [Periophthalmus magnuspinnatus]|uniref:EF-hand calcium-binding domain-containing protein 10 n=1 Tax=Periophthalmus magnuspinnatus TaxID=409849 RepID=UPI00145B9D40|nr:EF-hand calcium-binding domain-containing protein 10 [Periophthalmus magnuspinnatus]KAJ0029132.1 hypothetical protein NQD34_004129 [Periophthalmus magnuspinnatus]